jgi:hypothetical protein
MLMLAPFGLDLKVASKDTEIHFLNAIIHPQLWMD